jgi:mannose-6-phosphate isomerase-like protein (cupin superfamily)
MDWHSTGDREELLILLAGRVEVEARPGGGARRAGASARITRVALSVGQCAFIPSEIPHRVFNRSRTAARYLYVTAPTS